MIVCFRCDANADIGFGHFSRCLSLANALKTHGFSAVFLMTESAAEIVRAIGKNNHRLLILTPKKVFDSVADSTECMVLLKTHHVTADLLIVDHYQIKPLWWQPFQSANSKIMVLNDTGLAIDNIDCIWDLSATDNDIYQSTTNSPLLLLGPQYALLREEFASVQKPEPVTVVDRIKLLVCIGATDPVNTGGLLLGWLQSLDLQITLLTTSANPHVESLLGKYQAHRHIKVVVDSSEVAQLMAQQQLIITAAGNACWEAFSLGVPCLIVKTCENQRCTIDLITTAMDNVYLGEEQNLDKDAVLDKVSNLTQSAEKLSGLAQKAHQLCDGKGSRRVAAAIASMMDANIGISNEDK